MLSKLFNLLAISVSELDPIVQDAPEDHTKEIVIIVPLGGHLTSFYCAPPDTLGPNL